jgi:hypothetical protein
MSDPGVIETLVVKADEITTALEASERGTETALRVTAPFKARMRARLHVEQPGDEGDQAQVLIPPEWLLDDDCPPLPRSDDTAAQLRANSDEQYSVERHREAHETALAEWRAQVPRHVVDRLEIPGVTDAVAVSVLGSTGGE